MTSLSHFVNLLICLSEKGAALARLIRREKGLFQLLIEEKTGAAKNKRFEVDFMTLADVLIQETVRYFIGHEFPSMQEHVFGEESNKFTDKNGRTFVVTVGPTISDTVKSISQVLVSHEKEVLALAQTIHKPVNVPDRVNAISNDVLIDDSNIGIWIDPIDGTNEYVKGAAGVDDNGVYSNGLQCVTILMGAYDKTTGEALIGIVNQPFHRFNEAISTWEGRCVWGGSLKGITIISENISARPVRNGSSGLCLVSGSEDPDIVKQLESSGNFEAKVVAGCGYKLLCVIDGHADAYILSQSSSYKWDTCGPHAILKALGGNIVSFNERKELSYLQNDRDSITCNGKGIICYSCEHGYLSLSDRLS
jgi:inositol polyphosphate 1-phosphatase